MTRNTSKAAVLQSPLSLFLEWLQRGTRTSPLRLPRSPTRSPSLPAASCPTARTSATSTSRASEASREPRHGKARPATTAQPTTHRLSLPCKTLRTDQLLSPDHTHTHIEVQGSFFLHPEGPVTLCVR